MGQTQARSSASVGQTQAPSVDLSHFPPEVLSGVVDYLKWHDIRILLLCGCKTLHHKLITAGGIGRIEVDAVPWSKPTSRIISQLPALHSMVIKFERELGLETAWHFIASMPSTLTKLRVLGEIPNSLEWVSTLRSATPNLQHLIVDCNSSFYPEPRFDEKAAQSLPEGLLTLRLPFSSFRLASLPFLPSGLTSLSVLHFHGSNGAKLALPASLETLEVGEPMASFDSFPSTLTALIAEPSSFEAMMRLGAKFPLLKRLTLRPSGEAMEDLAASGTTWPEFVATLPNTLEHFSVDIYDYDLFADSDKVAQYPPKAVTFSPIVFGYSKTSRNLEDTLKCLPPAMTKADLWAFDPLLVHHFAMLPRSLTKLRLGSLCPSFPIGQYEINDEANELIKQALKNLPKRLATLKWAGKQPNQPILNVHTIPALPPHLTRLQGPSSAFATFKGLSSFKLVRLVLNEESTKIIVSSTLTSLDLTFLPPCLRHLSISIADKANPSVSRDWKNWMSILAKSCPVLDHLYFNVPGCSSSHADGLKYLPKSLKYLMILPCVDLNDKHVKYLPPNLRSIYLSDTSECRITDQSAELWPRSLTSLTIPRNTLLTEACCEKLPKSLESLQLGDSEPNFWQKFRYGFDPSDYCETPWEDEIHED
jgi:hypothetical protein